MKILLLRFAALALCVVLQLSFFDIAFPWFHIPVFLIAAIAAWTLVLGFSEALWMIMPLTIAFEIFSSGVLGAFSLYAIFVSYAVSFLSSRISASRSGAGIVLYGIFVAALSLAYQGAMFVLLRSRTDAAASDVLRLPSEFSPGMLALSALLVLCSFLIAYPAIAWFEERMRSIAQRQFLNVR